MDYAFVQHHIVIFHKNNSKADCSTYDIYLNSLNLIII